MNLQNLFLTITMLLSGIQFSYAAISSDVSKKTASYTGKSLTLSSMVKPMTQDKNLFGISSLSYTFSGTTADTINYIQLCYATDNTCSSCNVPFTTITSGTPIPYSTGGTTYGVSPASIAAYLSTNGFSGTGSPTYNIGIYVQSTHLNCSSSTAYCSTKTGSNAHLLCMQATYNGTSVTALAQSDNGNAILNTGTSQYNYVGSEAGGAYQCSLNSSGTFNTCQLTPSAGAPSWFPSAITFAQINGTQYAYLADGFSTQNLYRCTLNSDGTFNACAATPSSSAPNWSPDGIAFATVNGVQFAYVGSNTSGGHVYQCTLNSNGTFNTCTITPSTGAPSWGGRAGVTFATVNGTQYAYVGSYSGSSLYQCSLNSNGTFNTCAVTPSAGAPSWVPFSLAFATVNGTQYAYVADENGNIYQCTLNSNGTFNTCTATPSTSAPAWQPIGLAFATVNGTQYAYVGDQNTNMYQCSLNSNGTFNTCSITPSTGAPSWAPASVAFAFITS